jgi:hypothetical protein
MPKPKVQPTPKAYVWIIFDPVTGSYYKRTPNAHYGRWVSVPYGYGSENLLLKALAAIRAHHPKAQVIPYSQVPSFIVDVEQYGL